MKICVIGCGSIAYAAHGPALRRLQQEGMCTLSGCCDLKNAAAFCESFGFAHAYDDYEAMLNTEQPDAVFLFMPVRLSAACARRVMEMGYPVIMEKPPGVSAAEAQMLADIAEKTGVFNAVLFNRRSMPLVLKAKALLADAAMDSISLEMCRYARTGEDFTTTAVHGLDCLRFLAGSGYSRIHMEYQVSAQRDNTNYYASGTFENGIHFDMRFLPDAGAVTERLAISARGAQYYLDLPVWSGTEYTEGFDCPGRLVGAKNQEVILDLDGQSCCGTREGFVLNGFYDEDRLVLEALAAGQPTPFPIETGKEAVAISEALRARKPYFERR